MIIKIKIMSEVAANKLKVNEHMTKEVLQSILSIVIIVTRLIVSKSNKQLPIKSTWF